MGVSVEGEGNRTAGEVYIEDRSVQTVHHHYYAEAAGRVPESQLQAEFHAHTGMWCPRCAREVLETLKMLAEEGMTMICVTHEMAFARDVSDRVAYFHKGIMAEIGAPDQIFGNPQHPETQKFLASVR